MKNLEILEALVVYNPVNNRIRLGRNIDGGYIIIDGYDYDFFISGGLCEVSFEEAFAKKYSNVPGVAFDNKFDEPTNFPKNVKYIKKTVGALNDESNTNFREYLEKYKDVFIKLDIESREWNLFPVISDLFTNIKQIVFEAHSILYLPIALECIQMIIKTHNLVHVHENNNCNVVNIENNMYPDLLELTFIRKDCEINGLNTTDLPIKDLDYPNIPTKIEHNMNMWPFNSK